MNVEKDIDRILTLLRNKIREKGYTQLEVQEALSWGRSYISQLLTKQKSLRVEQILLILQVIGVEPAEFYGELYHFSAGDGTLRNVDDYSDKHLAGQRAVVGELVAAERDSAFADLRREYDQMRSMLRAVVRLLIEKKVLQVDELNEAARDESQPDGVIGELT